MRFWLVVIIFMTAFSACKKETIVAPTVPLKSFQYTAYDSSGVPLVSGTFNLYITDSSNVGGDWHFRKVGNSQNTGPQYGDGELAGGFSHGLLAINLNPKYVDNNVFLSGQYSATKYSGTWSYTGFPGVLNRGSFQAYK